MIQPVIARKPKFAVNSQRSPTYCIIKAMQRMIGIKQKGENKDEEKSDTDGIRS